MSFVVKMPACRNQPFSMREGDCPKWPVGSDRVSSTFQSTLDNAALRAHNSTTRTTFTLQWKPSTGRCGFVSQKHRT